MATGSDGYVDPLLSASGLAALRAIMSDEYLDVTARNNEIMNWMPIDNDAGEFIKQPVKTGTTTSHGASDVAVLSSLSSLTRNAFTPPFIPNYAANLVSQHEINVSSNNETAIVKSLADNLNDCRRRLAIDWELAAAGDGFGTRGIIASTTGSGPYVITTTTVADVTAFEVNQTYVTSAANNSSSLDTGSITVTAVDQSGGTVTVTANGGWTPTNGHYIFLSNDKVSGAYSTPLKFFGFDAYLPMVNRARVLAGVDSTPDVQSLAGVFVTASGKSIRAAMNLALGKLAVYADANTDTMFMGPQTLQRFQDELGNSLIRIETKDWQVNGERIAINGPRGPIALLSSHSIKEDRFYLLTRDTWKYWNAMPGDVIGAASVDTKEGLVNNPSTFGVQVRQMTDGNITCAFPGANAVVKLV